MTLATQSLDNPFNPMTEETIQDTPEYQVPKHDPSPLSKVQSAITRTHYEMLIDLAKAKDIGMSELMRSILEQWTSDNYHRELTLWSSNKN